MPLRPTAGILALAGEGEGGVEGMVGLPQELALLYAQFPDPSTQLRRPWLLGEIKSLAGQMLQIFESRDVHREAIAALILFQKAARAEAVTLQMARDMSTYLKRARRYPKMRFETPS